MDRIAMLREILVANPEDTFARYGLAMEYSKAGQIEQALEEYKRWSRKIPITRPHTSWLHKHWPARGASMKPSDFLVDGISSARRTGNQHAQSEMTAMLEEMK